MFTDAQFTGLVKKYIDTVFRVAFSYLKNREDADDVVQNPYQFDLIDPNHEDRVWEDCFEILDMRIHYADGTEFIVQQREWFDDEERNGLYPVAFNCYYGLHYDGAKNMEYLSLYFNQIIDVENVVSIELNGTHYYVDQFE